MTIQKPYEKQDADRYSVIICHPSELLEKIGHAQRLGLRWFARSDFGQPENQVMLYLFFDEAGLQKYLSKEWGNKLDMVAEWVEEVKASSITDVVFVQRVIELFD